MSDKLKVKPREGVNVRRQENGMHIAEGEYVPNNSFYRRRIKDGDLIKIEENAATEKAPVKKGDK